MLARGPAGPAHSCVFILASIQGETAVRLHSGGQLRIKGVFIILLRKTRKTQGALEGRCAFDPGLRPEELQYQAGAVKQRQPEMHSSRAYMGALLLVALAVCSPVPLNGYVIRTASTFATDTTTASSVPVDTAVDATTDSAVPVATAAVAATPTVKTPAATVAPTPTPTIKVPPPFTVQDTVKTTTDNSTDSADTALYSVLRIIGSEVTPFNLARQSTLLNALGQVISTVDFGNISISDVNPVYSLNSLRRRRVLLEATSHQEMLSGPRRSLLADTLSNVADVTVQLVADASSIVPAVLTELNYSIVNGTLDLMYSNITTPGGINATVKSYCHDKFGHWCLDKYKHLSSAGIRGVIAGGIIGIICVAALALILKDLHGARKMKDDEVVYNPQTPNLGGGPGAGKVGAVGGATALTATAGGTPSSARNGTPTAGYTGGLAPVGQKVRRKSGAFTSGAVTHPASLAAAGKPTGLEEMVSSPSFSRGNTPGTTPSHQSGL
ncbi:TPA: hypothetical protein ACH3X1_001820 [Trebouxia sp. C0004]